MPSNLDRYKKDLDALVEKGERLHLAIQAQWMRDEFVEVLKKEKYSKEQIEKTLGSLPVFSPRSTNHGIPRRRRS